MSTTRATARALIVAVLLATGAGALGAAFPATLRVPRRDPRNAPGVPCALFSHRGHDAMGCQACHPSVFPQQRVTFTHAEIDAAEAGRRLNVKRANETKRLREALRYGGHSPRVDLDSAQIHGWDAGQRKEAFAFVKAHAARGWNEPPPATPAFIQVAVDEQARLSRREEMRSRLRRRKWAAGDRQGKAFDFELRVTDSEIDAEEARAAKGAAA